MKKLFLLIILLIIEILAVIFLIMNHSKRSEAEFEATDARYKSVLFYSEKAGEPDYKQLKIAVSYYNFNNKESITAKMLIDAYESFKDSKKGNEILDEYYKYMTGGYQSALGSYNDYYTDVIIVMEEEGIDSHKPSDEELSKAIEIVTNKAKN